MPIYEYKCSECNTKFDVLYKSATNPENVHCPACDSTKNKKLFSSFSSTTKNELNFSAGSCQNGNCGLPNTRCSSGLCDMN